jgi:hypothetical protein
MGKIKGVTKPLADIKTACKTHDYIRALLIIDVLKATIEELHKERGGVCVATHRIPINSSAYNVVTDRYIPPNKPHLKNWYCDICQSTGHKLSDHWSK